MIKAGLCVGLDFKASLDEYIDYIKLTNADVYKVNPAFTYGVVVQLAKYFKENKIAWIYDAKLGDVLHTNKAYAEYVYEALGASGVTLNAFVGFEALAPFFKYKDKVSFILCRTTNSGAEYFQANSYKKIINFVKNKPNLGIVYAGNKEADLEIVSSQLENNIILAPGIGAQGGVIKAHSNNVLYSVSRSVYLSESPSKTVALLKTQINSNRLFEVISTYIKYGNFTLSSGQTSNYYIDLKSMTKDVAVFDYITELIKDKVVAKAILGIESGSISYATATALKAGLSFGFIRTKSKDYGTNRRVEALDACEVTIIEDVLTTGKSLEKAVSIAEEEGFIVKQVIVIVNRNPDYKTKYNLTSLVELP